MCISLGPLEPYAIIGLILSHYGAAAAEVAVSDVGELKAPLECERNLCVGRNAGARIWLSQSCDTHTGESVDSPDFGGKM